MMSSEPLELSARLSARLSDRLSADAAWALEAHARYAALRRDLHAHPELAFEERRTAAVVAAHLRALPLAPNATLEVVEGLARTGVVARLRVGSPDAPSLRRVGLRADLDALPMREEGCPEHRSRVDGCMHACGHDGHTALLLMAAERLCASPPEPPEPPERADVAVEVILIFQPAEENLAGGRVMVEEGLFERFPVDEVFGLHNLPGHPLGQLSARVGPQMASADFFEVVLEGVGGHAAWPHRCADPVVAAAELALAWQSVVSRGVDPLAAAVLSVTRLQAGESDNAIPSRALLRGTVRALDEGVRAEVEGRMRRVAEGVCAAHDLRLSWRYERRYTATVNAPAPTARALAAAERAQGALRAALSPLLDPPAPISSALSAEAARALMGASTDPNPAPLMGAEDFGWMLRARPGCYALLGAGERPMLHHPRYDFEDALLPLGALYWVSLARGFCAR
jgi:amidohydrolase